jgi:hypothetical protein
MPIYLMMNWIRVTGMYLRINEQPMNNNRLFKILLLLARPAAGKSEIIQYLQGIALEDRINRFHIGRIQVIDDFPMIWTWFEEDDLLTKMGFPRIYTDEKGYFLHQYLWDLLIERMNIEYTKFLRDKINYEEYTVFIEFSRGKEHGGYKSAFAHLSEEIVDNASILYIDVSWEESLRKNRKRFNPEKPDSILEHALPDEKLTRMYCGIDWDELTMLNKEFMKIGTKMVPYSILENEDDVTSRKSREELDKRLKVSLDKLWLNYLH